MHYSPYFISPLWLECIFPATGTKAGVLEGCHTWMSLTLSDTECPAETCHPQTWSLQNSQALGILDSHLPAGAAPPGFQPVLVREETVYPLYLPPFHSQYASYTFFHANSAERLWNKNISTKHFIMIQNQWPKLSNSWNHYSQADLILLVLFLTNYSKWPSQLSVWLGCKHFCHKFLVICITKPNSLKVMQCVCVCVRACVCACVCACVRAKLKLLSFKKLRKIRH